MIGAVGVGGFSKQEKSALIARIERRIQANVLSECWIWTGQRLPKGYGQLRVGGRAGRNIYVHRLMFALKIGDVPQDALVLHACDEPRCCNPAHLRLGTAAENSAEMVLKARHPRGEKRPGAKLTFEQIRQIRTDPRNGHELAAVFGVSFSQIARIRRRELWAHVD